MHAYLGFPWLLIVVVSSASLSFGRVGDVMESLLGYNLAVCLGLAN